MQDRSVPLTKLCFHRDATYNAVLEKCRRRFWGSEEAEYYLADGGGASIAATDLEVGLSDGSVSKIPWTLQNYLRVTGLRFPSRTRLYCVQKLVTGA